MRRQTKEVKLRLEHYSEKFAKRLFQHYPQWKQYAGHYEREEDGFPVCYLQVHVPSANSSVTEPLEIITYPHEVIISWIEGWHRHFEQWPHSQDDLSYMDCALESIAEFVADILVTCSYYRAGKPTGGGFDFNILAKDDSPSSWFDPKHGQVVVRSWHGKHDKVVNSEDEFGSGH